MLSLPDLEHLKLSALLDSLFNMVLCAVKLYVSIYVPVNM